MSITILKMDGSTEITEPVPGVTCKQAMIDKGIVSAPPQAFTVNFENRNVDNEPLSNYDNKKLSILPVKKEGGR